MAKNEFKPFATASGANVTSQSDYEALPVLSAGFQSGKASSAQINKAIRQATVIASVVAQFIANESEEDVLDDGDVAALQQSLLAALKQNAADNIPKASTTVAGIAKLSSATDSSDETVAATPKAVKAANDNASTRLLATGTAAAATKLATARTIGGVSFDGTANINLPGVNAAGNQATTGNAATATKLATARTIGGVSFDGSANINLPGVNAAGNQDTTGNADTATTATKLATARTIGGVAFDGSANINLPGVNAAGTQATTGNAATATKLAAAITIGGVSFDGSANINLPGVNAAGTQATTGNAATATKLATARTIGGVSFDGTANINLPGVNAAGNQATTGNAATTTKLATARTINGVAFDGSANVTIPVSNSNMIASCWAIFPANTSTPTLTMGQNVSSITYVSSGFYEINFATALNNTNYMITGSCEYSSGGLRVLTSMSSETTKTTTKCRVACLNINNGADSSTSASVVTFGGL